ncbi:MAG: non-ribosomal peptide synthetase, partial [bacterium]|nr:non-ribosomal peptide synthetase [bacterium]
GIEPAQLREYLFETLPDYMIPGRFVTLERMPLTTSGKVDHRELAGYDEARLEIRTRYAAPGTAAEKLITEVWKEVLSLEEVGIHDNFFRMGGTSFGIIKISTILNRRLGIDFQVVKMFKYPTIHTLATFLTTGETPVITVEEEKKKTKKVEKGRNRLRVRSRRNKK